MATPRAASKVTPAPTAPTEFSLTLGESNGVARATKEGSAQKDPWYPTVLAGYEASFDSRSARSFPNLPSKELAERVVRLLMAVSKTKSGTSLAKSITSGKQGHTVDFKVTDKPRQHKYTADDVRKWARENLPANQYDDIEKVLIPKIHPDIRVAYRKAHGLYVKDGSK